MLPVTFDPDLTRRWLDLGLWPDRTLDDYVAGTVSSAPERLAVVDSRGRMMYSELDDAARRCAGALRSAGVQRGDVISVQLPNWSEFVVVAVAAARLGAVLNPLAAILRENELRRMLELCHPRVMIIAAAFRHRDYVAEYVHLVPTVPSLTTVVVVDAKPGLPAGWQSWSRFVDSGAWCRTDPAEPPPSPREVCELTFTSGTSGEPKGVMHTANTLASCAEAMVRLQPVTGDDVLLIPSTFGHQTAYIWGIWMTFVAGCTLVLQESWNADEFFRLVETERVTMFKGSTPYLVDIAARLDDQRLSAIRSLETFFLGGAPIPRHLAEQMKERAPFRLSPCWGMSENGPVTATWPPDDPGLAATTDGHPYPGMEVEVRGPGGEPLYDKEGALFVRGPFNFAGYVQGPEFTRPYLSADGWLDTGDQAVLLSGSGCIRITGRRKDIIVRGGENLPVVELEQLIAQMPEVVDVALVGVPDPRLGEIACAVVQVRPGAALSLSDITEFLDGRKVTKQFLPEALAIVGEMPRTVSGKIKKHELKLIAQEHAGSRR